MRQLISKYFQNIRYESSTSQVNSFVEMKLLPSNVSEQAQLQYSSVRPSTSQPKWVI